MVARFLKEQLDMKHNIKCFCDSFHDDSVENEIENIPVYSPIKATEKYPNAKQHLSKWILKALS